VKPEAKRLFWQLLKRYRRPAAVALGASTLLNVLLFAGSLYLLLVYDAVLPSRSVPTLFGLFGMLVVVYLFHALFDAIRSSAMLSIADGVHRDLAPRVHHAGTSRPLRAGRGEGDGVQLVRDLDNVHSFVAGNGPIALIDLPWVVVFLAVLTLLHVWLGVAALFGVLVMAAIAIVSSIRTRDASHDLARTTGERSARLQAELRLTEAAAALGMRERMLARSAEMDDRYRTIQGGLAAVVARFGGAGRVFRIFLQSLILTVGAMLVIDGKATAGIIIAASVLSGRALAPVDQAIGNWRGLVAASSGWRRIVDALIEMPPPAPRQTALAPPSQGIALNDVWVVPPGSQTPVVQGVRLKVERGQVLAVIGPSAAGKTSLVKALLGIWKPARGEIRLDGALHEQWDPEALGAAFGYVPQTVELVDGTIAENIARLDPDATSEGVIAAATKAGLHETILALPDGYDTRVSGGGGELSAGQRQRIGLARALYGDPFLLVLDEANSNLDDAGDRALAEAVTGHRQRGGIVVMITHRPATLGPATHIAVLATGKLADYGPRDEVLKRVFKQVPDIRGREAAA
jgi:ATP-binding cassette subfamily C protein PrsD